MRCVPLVTLGLAFACQWTAPAQDATGNSPPRQKSLSPLRELMDDSLSWNELLTSESATRPMTARVVLRWTNNARGSEDGMTVLYLWQGRPEAVCCVYPWEQKLNHEFDSLSRGTFVARRDGVVAWRPAKPGLDFKPIPGADPPAKSPAARLRQMKGLACQFSSTMLGWRSSNADREVLRLLPQPLYRYESQRSDLLDGAVFAFVQGTDPESLLLIEAFQQDEGFEWQFAFARRTSGELEARHDGNLVWHVPRFPQGKDPLLTHFGMGRAIDPALLNPPEQP